MKKIGPLILGLIFCSQAAATSALKYEVWAHSYAQSVESTQVESRLAGLYLQLMAQYTLSPELSFDLAAGALLETGTDRSLWISEFNPDQQVVLEEAYFHWRPLSWFTFKAGALAQDYYDLPTLLDSSAFVGAREEIKWQFGAAQSLSLESQQALPSNETLANRLGDVESGTPKFFLHRALLNLDGDLLALALYAGHFEFRDLSEGVAHQSRFLGNSVIGALKNNASFKHGFKGQFYGGELKWFLSEGTALRLKGHLLKNNEALARRNQARLVSASFLLDRYEMELQQFRLESDASVGFYNSKILAHNNREGLALHLTYHGPDYSLKGIYSASDVISFSNVQSEQTFIALEFTKRL